ncbi:MAG: tetratricopeptide (TPR) repeat protein [Glaciecola sp.]|jgi:tetratricopeptide (TPR) repeat protein
MALEIAEANNSKKDVLLALNNVGLAYKTQGNLIGALEIYLRCLNIQEVLKYSDSKKAPFLQNIGNIYSELGNYKFKRRKYLCSTDANFMASASAFFDLIMK